MFWIDTVLAVPKAALAMCSDAITMRSMREAVSDFAINEPPWIDKDLEALRDKVLKDKKLKSGRIDDEFLLRFLRARKFDSERAYKMLKNYYDVKKKYPEVFTDFTPTAMMDALKANFLTYLVEPDDKGRYIALGRASAWDVSKFSLLEIIRVGYLFLEDVIKDPAIQTNGFILLLDAKGLTARHLLQLSPRLIFLIINVFLDSFPVRYKGIHIFNTARIVDIVVTAFWPFLPTKFKQRIVIHNSLESLHAEVNPKYLPEEYGGQAGSFNNEHCIKRLVEQQDYLKEQQQYWL